MTDSEMIDKVNELCDMFLDECSIQEALQIITGTMFTLTALAVVKAEETESRGEETKQDILEYLGRFTKTLEKTNFGRIEKLKKGS